MRANSIRSAVLAVSLLAGLPWVRSGAAVPREKARTAATLAATAPAESASDRVVLLSVNDPDYRALAIPRSYKTSPDAPKHLLVFRGGLCVRDIGLVDAKHEGDNNPTHVEESGTTTRAFVAWDGTAAVIVGTRYVSRVDLTPGQKSTAGDTVTGDTTLTLIDPTHTEGRWRVTLENARWVKDVVTLSASKGVAVTTFLPRTGPTDLRILDATGHEAIRVPESQGTALHVGASPDGGYVASEIAFRDSRTSWDQGVMVFDLAGGSQWTYGWKYGSEAEPLAWELQSGGVLSVKQPSGTRRFDPKGRTL